MGKKMDILKVLTPALMLAGLACEFLHDMLEEKVQREEIREMVKEEVKNQSS